MTTNKTIDWNDERKALVLLDQRLLPGTIQFNTYEDAASVAAAIRDMVVRGAPAIGVSAVYGLAAEAHRIEASDTKALFAALDEADAVLRAARPTAVNLFWALDECWHRLAALDPPGVAEARHALVTIAHRMALDDIADCLAMGAAALKLFGPEVTFIHHCNTGALATVDYGTALGVIRIAHESGRQVHVYVDETRPRLQGAKLTSWELTEHGIAHQIIVDGASGHVMRRVGVDCCIVGSDRIAINGDVANKIGTYNLAVVADANGVPFYVAAPLSTVDPDMASGDSIEIEERDVLELLEVDGKRVAPEGAQAFNPAFDVTPHDLVTAIITEEGVIYPPYAENLRAALARKKARHA